MRVLQIALASLVFAAAPAAAEEKITSYVSDVAIQSDSSLEVTETIDVNSEGDQIRHGIYRDFPTLYTGRNGRRVRVGFTFEGAEMDGHPEHATTEPLSNGVRIKIGDADTLIDPGSHSFVIHYRTTRQIGRFGDYDELYWNATGNGWAFPIDVAEARIRLPLPAKFGQWSVYTGPQGSTEHNAAVVAQSPGRITFRTTAPLEPYEGLTVAVAFSKGVVGPPTGITKFGWWLSDYGPPLVGVIGLVIVVLFYFVAWHRVGRDPKAGTIVPLFSPPDDLSPAAMRYVLKEEADNRAFAAALVDMGVHGHIKLVEEDRGWLEGGKKTRIDRLQGGSELPEDERAALSDLVEPGESIMMEQKNHQEFSSAKSALDTVLKEKYEGKLFRRNYGWSAAGLLIFLTALWLTGATVALATGLAFGMFLLPFGALVAAGLFSLWIRERKSTAGCVAQGGFALCLFLATSTGLPLFVSTLATGWYFPMLLPALALPIVLSAFWWMSAPTIDGRSVLDHIAGFKQYLSITERERLDRMTPPEDTPELFEKYLPYAIALGVENRWADRFAPVLAAAAAQGRQGFAWYSGSSSPWNNTNGFVNSVGSSLASTVSSASTAPGSSSGSGGGGSSGGGGGGGGGGGW